MSRAAIPHDAEAEAGALACVLQANGEATALLEQLAESDFHDERHLEIFRALVALQFDGRQLGVVELFQLLKDQGGIEAAGGFDYVQRLPDATPSPANFDSFLETVKDRTARRAMLTEASAMAERARDLRTPVEVAMPEDQLKARLFDGTRQPPEIRAVFTLAGKVIATPGNLSTIAAPVKTGKSAVVGGLLAATMCQDADRDCLGFASSNERGLAVLHFDTEQSPEDHWWLVRRAIIRSGVGQAPEWLRSYCLTGLSARQAWQFVRRAVSVNARTFGGVHSVLLDGAADLVSDVNDAAECNGFVAELHGMGIERACPILGVIHFNPGSEKTRGHLGSQLERKAETNLRLEKSSEVIEIFSEKQRRAPILKGSGPCFTWDDKAGMHVSTTSRDKSRDEERKDRESGMVDDAFLDRPSMRYSDLISTAKALKKCSERTAARKVKDWDKLGLIKKSVAGLWIKAT